MPAKYSLLLVVALLIAAAACGPVVGDDCTSDYDCGASNSCDLSIPDGYCTRTPCSARGCEDEEAVCIQFFNGESYCMLECGGSGDCRDKHTCHAAGGMDSCGGDDACAPRRSSSASYCYAY